jgi:hypothetical protein
MFLERVRRIELPYERWQRSALPLSYTRIWWEGVDSNHRLLGNAPTLHRIHATTLPAELPSHYFAQQVGDDPTFWPNPLGTVQLWNTACVVDFSSSSLS